MTDTNKINITVEAVINADVEKVWDSRSAPFAASAMRRLAAWT